MLEKICLVGVFCTGRTQEVFLSLAFVIAKGENIKRGSEKKNIHTYNKCLCVCIYKYIYIYNFMK